MGFLKKLMKFGGIVAVLLGIVFTLAGAYGLAGGTGTAFTINERVVTAQEQSIVGVIVLLGGIALTYFGLKFSRQAILSIVLGLCSLIIPAILLGIGINLVAGVVFVFSYSFVAMVFLWFARARKVSAFVGLGIFEFSIGSFLVTIIENSQLLNVQTPQIGLHIFLISIILGMFYYASRAGI